MAYKAIVDFKDLQTGHDYKVGDAYPFEGEADKERVRILITPTTQRGALIEEIAEKKPVVKSEDKAEKPTRKSKEKK